MTVNRSRLAKRFFVYSAICIITIGVIHIFSSSLISCIPTFNPFLFPVMTIFLLILHITVSSFMMMKYWCNRKRRYLIPIASAFAGSSLLMFGTLSSHPGGGLCDSNLFANANAALIFYSFRNMMMLFNAAIILYYFRHSPKLTRTVNFFVLRIFLRWLFYCYLKTTPSTPGIMHVFLKSSARCLCFSFYCAMYSVCIGNPKTNT